MPEERDLWSKIDIVLKAVSGIALPVALFWFGHQYNVRQDAAAEATRQSERLSSLLGPLSSDNQRERKLAIEMAGYLAKIDQLPLELVPVITSIAKGDPSAATAQAASSALYQVEEANPQIKQQIESDLGTLPARVYVHINSQDLRPAANALVSRLTEKLGSDFVVPGIEFRPGPSINELRFFKAAESDEAYEIANALESLSIEVKVQDLSKRYENSKGIRPRHYELWLADPTPAPNKAMESDT